MFDDPIDDAFEYDPRIDVMVRQAGTITDLILNADFLLGEYVNELLKARLPLLEMAGEIGLTAEQRCRLVVWDMGVREGSADLNETFDLMLAICRARVNLGRLSPQKLIADLGSVYVRECHPESDEEYVLGADPFANVRYAVAGYLGYAQRFLKEAAEMEPDEDTGEE